MSFVTAALIGAGGALVGGMLSADAASSAASTQAAAADRAAELQRQTAQEQLALQQRMYEEGVARQQPWLEAGQGALNKLIPMATNYQRFGMDQFQQDPGYQFRMSEGMKALDRQAAARGGLISGGAMKAAQRYGQDLASQEYQNAFNRYQTERSAALNPLQSLAGVGQTTANQLGAAGQQYATSAGNIMGSSAANIGDYGQAAAAARASGYTGGANALTGAIGTGLNFYQSQQMMNMLAPQQQTYAYGGSPSGPGDAFMPAYGYR